MRHQALLVHMSFGGGERLNLKCVVLRFYGTHRRLSLLCGYPSFLQSCWQLSDFNTRPVLWGRFGEVKYFS